MLAIRSRTLTAVVNAEPECRLGVLAFGDSITNGGGELQWGVALQSWAMWVARSLGLALTNYAVDGAGAGDVVAAQMPAFEHRSAHPEARYELGCLYIGVNDVRSPQWNPRSYEKAFRGAVSFLRRRCDRVLVVTAPLDLGRPRACTKVNELDEVIERVARELGALVLDLRGFRGRNLMMPDHVHPTAFGQIAIAEHALDVLERNGLLPSVRPSSLIAYETSRSGKLRGDWTYAYRHLKVSARALAVQARALYRGSLGEN